jgi:hypothetical protein
MLARRLLKLVGLMNQSGIDFSEEEECRDRGREAF